MQGKISMDLSFCQSENGFSLDELVTKLAEVYDRKAFAELLKMILQMVQELLMYRIFHGETDAGAWEDYWQKRMQIIGNVVIGVGNYKCVSQNLGQ
ncbi:hypothetical protein [Victivallis sp. Marseille-Q1083]|uniref:hypothetical protein n=1 Tax=Victivallis sp. Marseille-Q1083 TaxID=2717288 RepID=UPI0015894ADB|nr:hypothetical protein [Victivallis sp. Marseille-Q1083]